MKIIDKYIIKKVLYTLLFVVLIITAVIVVIDISEKMEDFVKHQVKLIYILGYYRDFAFWIMGVVTPLMVFISVVFVTSQMASRTELIAVFGSGMSFQRLLLPYFFASFFIAAFHFLLNGWVIPEANESQAAFHVTHLKKKYSFNDNDIHMQIEPNVYFYVQSYNTNSQTGYKFSLERFDNKKLIERLTADNITWDSTKGKWSMHSWAWELVDSAFHLGGDSSPLATMSGERMDTTLTILPKDFRNIAREYSSMTINELNAHIKKLRFRGASGVEAFEVELHLRYASPFIIFVLVFLGVVISVKKTRGGTGFNIALGFFLSFVLIIFFMVTRASAEAGSLPPLVAAWIPGISFSIITFGLYKYSAIG